MPDHPAMAADVQAYVDAIAPANRLLFDRVHRLISEGTVEDRIATVLAEKQALADAVVGGGEAWLTELTDDELTELVRLGDA